jgi:predicted phage-related endonuclease
MAIERHPIMDGRLHPLRKLDVTASVIGALPGNHPYTSRLRLWAEKRGVEFLDNDNKAKRRGRWLESAVAEAVREKRPDWKIEPARCYLRDPDHRLGATPDFWIHGDPRGIGVLQAKSAAPITFKTDWAEGADVPTWITLQTATEMMLADAAFGAVAVLLVDPYDMDCFIHEVPRNAAAEAKIIAMVDAFWQDVEAGREPDLDPRRDHETVRALTAKSVAGLICDLSGNNRIPGKLIERAALMRVIDDARQEKEAIETEVIHLLGSAEIATGIPGWRVTYKSGDRAGYTVKPKTGIRTLRIFEREQ